MKKLFLDYEICNGCEKACQVKCSYIMHPENLGVTSLRELASFALACRRCEDYPCVNACPTGALKREEGVNRRSTFICVSCKTCSLACPFGTILPEVIPLLVSTCDFCLSRLAENELPLCVTSCPYAAVKYAEEDQLPRGKNIYTIGQNLVVRAVSWLEIAGIKK